MSPTLQKQKFYQALGHLFYAIAAADKTVRPKEINALKELIKTVWHSSEKEPEEVFQIQITFDRLTDQTTEAEEAMAVFKLFKEKHPDLFTAEIKKRIWTTVNTIAEAVAGKNKSELVLLSKLSVLMKS